MLKSNGISDVITYSSILVMFHNSLYGISQVLMNVPQGKAMYLSTAVNRDDAMPSFYIQLSYLMQMCRFMQGVGV